MWILPRCHADPNIKGDLITNYLIVVLLVLFWVFAKLVT